MIFYKQFNTINEIETLIFSFFTIKIFFKCNWITKYPRIFLSVSFLKGKNVFLFHPGGLTMDSKYYFKIRTPLFFSRISLKIIVFLINEWRYILTLD